MSYQWEAYAADPGFLLRELNSPSLSWDQVKRSSWVHDIAYESEWPGFCFRVLEQAPGFWCKPRRRWDGLSAPVELTAEQTDYLMVALEATGVPVGSLGFSSGGSVWFHDRLLGRDVAPVIGPQPAGWLAQRDLGPFRPVPFPTFGWLSHDEVAAASARLPPVDPFGLDEVDEGVPTIAHALHAAHRSGTGLVTVIV